MLKFIFPLFLSLTIVSSSAFAGSVESTENSLKANMKQANTLFKSIGAHINDPTKNTVNAKSAESMAEVFAQVIQQVPKSFDGIPEAQRAEALKGYQTLIQQCIDHSLSLQQAFLEGNNAAALNIYQEMKDLKKEGHEQFDP